MTPGWCCPRQFTGKASRYIGIFIRSTGQVRGPATLGNPWITNWLWFFRLARADLCSCNNWLCYSTKYRRASPNSKIDLPWWMASVRQGRCFPNSPPRTSRTGRKKGSSNPVSLHKIRWLSGGGCGTSPPIALTSPTDPKSSNHSKS